MALNLTARMGVVISISLKLQNVRQVDVATNRLVIRQQ